MSAAFNTYLQEMLAKKSSDLYLTVGLPPMFRINSDIVPRDDTKLTEENIQSICAVIMTPKQQAEFNDKHEMNLAIDRGGTARFRVNILRQKQQTAMVIRQIPTKIPTFEDLKLPKIMESLSLEKRGMVLVVGVTSSGKSTTLAAMLDHRNRTAGGHIITIEDPVEFYHDHKKGIVTQREVGVDTDSFYMGVKNALRQKPDVILVGEIRDPEVMEQAIGAAETGHLCYATLHTANAPQCIDRIINFFPPERQLQTRIALAQNLRAVVAQRLVRTVDGGLVATLEVMLNEALIREMILRGETTKIREVIANNTPIGMTTFDQSLFSHFRNGYITEQTAIAESELPTEMKMKINQHKMAGSGTGAMGHVDTSGLSL